MVFFSIFVLCAAAAAAAIVLAGGAWGLAVLGFVLAFLLAHVLLLLCFRLLTPTDDLSAADSTNRYDSWGAGQLGQLLCLYGGVRPVISGTEKLPTDTPFLFVSNHRSMFDPLIVMGWLQKPRVAFISKPSNLQIPVVGYCARAAGFLAIDRENDRAALKTVLQAADYLKRGLCSIGIYPEGTRSRTGELLPFHSGSFKIAQRAKAPLVIACVHGTEKARRGLFLRPRRGYLEILDCLPAERVAAMSTQELASYSRALIETRLKEVEGA